MSIALAASLTWWGSSAVFGGRYEQDQADQCAKRNKTKRYQHHRIHKYPF